MKKRRRNYMKKYLAVFLAVTVLFTSSSVSSLAETASAKEASAELLTNAEEGTGVQPEETTAADVIGGNDEGSSQEDVSDTSGVVEDAFVKDPSQEETGTDENVNVSDGTNPGAGTSDETIEEAGSGADGEETGEDETGADDEVTGGTGTGAGSEETGADGIQGSAPEDTTEEIKEDGTDVSEKTAGEEGPGEPEPIEDDIVPEPEAAPEEEELAEEEEDFSGLMSIEELTALDDESVGATMEKLQTSLFSLFRMTEGSTWTFDAYYVNQDDRNYVEKTHDFNLKYQMEFHASQDFEAGTIEIRIPAVLLTTRDGAEITPTDIAVPKGTLENYTASRSTPFNYYMDDETGELVFFNYKKITSGTNAAWQVLYKNLYIIEIKDMTAWKLTPSIEVRIPQEDEEADPIVETGTTEPLTGLVDSAAVLTSVTKSAFYENGKSYTPGLYTESQVENYISGSLPEKYSGENFSDYKYVVWLVTIKGSCTQPWNLLIKDTTTAAGADGIPVSGEIVGIKNWNRINTGNQLIYINTPSNADYADYTLVKGSCTPGRNVSGEYPWQNKFWVVTAYAADAVDPGTVLENDISVELVPIDGMDEPDRKDDSASWTYVNYDWIYRGNIIGIDKYSPSVPNRTKTYSSWLEVYRAARDRGEDWGDIPFYTWSRCYGYGYTHYIESTESGTVGERIPGTSYEVTTSDDFVYLYGGETPTADCILNGNDYYFSSVRITQTDIGYDVWEDEESAPEEGGGLEIYAMFADTNPTAATSDGWEHVATVEWKDSGILTYTFTKDQLARKPWRVKAVHEAVGYATFCDINVKVRLRYDSEKLAGLITDDTQSVTLENISGVQGEYHGQTEDDSFWFHDGTIHDGNYSEAGLADATRTLYGMLIQRDSAFAVLTGIEKQAESYKTATSTNDPVHSRVLVDYNLTAYDGYLIYGQEGMNYLKSSGVPSPGRNEVVFYDLLPYGMHFDPSAEVKAGRLKNLKTESKLDYRLHPELWDSTQVTVTVGDDDVIENYKGTGRTMVVFHIKYSGADSAVYWEKDSKSAGHWMEGWGVSFRAYYDWKDLDVAQDGVNISAFMPEDSEDAIHYQEPLYGAPGEVSCDDGVIPDVVNKNDYKYFGSDINGDGITDIANVLYARTAAIEDVARASESTITKLVRADSDRFGIYTESASVGTGEGYTYDITVSNADNEPMEDIVIYDRLEYASTDRAEIENDTWYPFDENTWTGEFQYVVTEGLEEMGIVPEIYYSASRDAKISAGTETPTEILTEANGWYTAERWEEEGKTAADVRAVAVDISKTSSGKFQLQSMEAVSFQIKMKAPEETPENGAVYAYNNSSFYSYHTNDTETDATVIGNSVRVSLGAKGQLEIVKEFTGEVPDPVKNTSFRFSLWQEVNGEKQAFANQEYQLWKKDESGEWVRQTGRLYATDESGYLYLHADEKALFLNLADVSRIQAAEEENPFWKTEVDDKTNTDDETGLQFRTIMVTNAYRPVLFVQKKLLAAPDDMDTSQYEFTFRLLAENENGELVPAADQEYWYVDRVRTDGGIPSKVAELGDNGTGMTSADGTFTIREGEIIALVMDRAGISWQLEEVDGALIQNAEGMTGKDMDADWVCYFPQVKGDDLSVYGASASISNIYRWKDLNLTKTLTHQDIEDCTQEFAFKVELLTDAENDVREPVVGNAWVLLDENGEETETAGTLDENGVFTAACGGQTVRIQKLEQGKTYIITETDWGEDYLPVNDTVEVTMPIYSMGRDIEITNDYLLRPLSVSKTVAYNPSENGGSNGATNREFAFTISKISEDRTAAVFANEPYILTENGAEQAGTYTTDEKGQFTLKHGQTATFKYAGKAGEQFRIEEEQDTDYPQLYPTNQEAHEVTMESEGSEVTFVNGTPGNLLIQKEFVGADSYSKNLVQQVMNHGSYYENYIEPNYDFSVKMELTVTTEDGETHAWPGNDSVTVQVLDQDTGEISTRPWSADGVYIYPWEIIVLTKAQLGENVVSYALKENKAYQQKVVPILYYYYLISQKEPSEDGAFIGTLETDPVAKIVNEMITLSGSTIQKWMTDDSDLVSEGAELVWRVERYDGDAWVPAEGISYLTFSDDGYSRYLHYNGERILTTGEDGKITLVKDAYGYPGIWILDESNVYLNRYSGMSKDDLRVVEVLEESDEEWGELAGYGSSVSAYPAEYSMDYSGKYGGVFFNTNQKAAVKIEKQMENGTEESFTMVLKRVLSASADPVTSADQIVSSEPGAGISYTIYDSETDRAVDSDVTTSSGVLTLKAGQYAGLELPKGTLWTISETQKSGYVLEDLSGSTGTTQLGDNLMLLQPEGEQAIVLTYEMVLDGVVNADTGQLVDWTQEEVEIPAYITLDGKRCKVIGIGKSAFNLYNHEELEDKISFTKAIIPSTVKKIGSYAFYGYKILQEVEIPDSVTYIESGAFRETGLTSVKVPDGVTYIGEQAFAYCYSLTEAVLSNSLKVIPEKMFYMCRELESVNIPDGVESIGKYAFFEAKITNISIPNSVKVIETEAFSWCFDLTSVTIPGSVERIGDGAFFWTEVQEVVIEEGVRKIGEQAFSRCSSLETIIIPSTIEKIGNNAFDTSMQNIYINRPEDSISGAPWGASKATIHWNSTGDSTGN